MTPLAQHAVSALPWQPSDEIAIRMYDMMAPEPKVVGSLQPVPSEELMVMGIEKYDSRLISDISEDTM